VVDGLEEGEGPGVISMLDSHGVSGKQQIQINQGTLPDCGQGWDLRARSRERKVTRMAELAIWRGLPTCMERAAQQQL
jgi:hypothetical protein